MSLLYDLDLLPEQVKKGSPDEWKLCSVVLHFVRLTREKPTPPER